MSEYTKEELQDILDKHQKWLNRDGGERANLRDAVLQRANLRDAVLRDAVLRDAVLRDADLEGAILSHNQIIPEEGSFVAWKKADGALVKVEIPADAKRVSALTGRKCRASKVKTLEVFDKEGNETDETEAHGRYDENTIYREGEITEPDEYDDDIRVECSHGIHFFVTRQEALEW